MPICLQSVKAGDLGQVRLSMRADPMPLTLCYATGVFWYGAFSKDPGLVDQVEGIHLETDTQDMLCRLAFRKTKLA